MENILVIGARGYIGSALTAYLRSQNLRVTSIDLQTPPTRVTSRDWQGDYADLTPSDISDFTTIVILAAPSSVAGAVQSPRQALVSGIVEFQGLLSKISTQKVIYAK